MCELLTTTTYFLPKSIYMSINVAQTFYGFKKNLEGNRVSLFKGVTKYFLKLPIFMQFTFTSVYSSLIKNQQKKTNQDSINFDSLKSLSEFTRIFPNLPEFTHLSSELARQCWSRDWSNNWSSR